MSIHNVDQKFINLIAYLGNIFRDASVNEQTVLAYSRTLADIDIEELTQACKAYARTGKRFPYPADLIELCPSQRVPNDSDQDDKAGSDPAGGGSE